MAADPAADEKVFMPRTNFEEIGLSRRADGGSIKSISSPLSYSFPRSFESRSHQVKEASVHAAILFGSVVSVNEPPRRYLVNVSRVSSVAALDTPRDRTYTHCGSQTFRSGEAAMSRDEVPNKQRIPWLTTPMATGTLVSS